MSELVHGSTGEAWYKRALEAHAEITRLQAELAEAKAANADRISYTALQKSLSETLTSLSAAQATIAKMREALEPFAELAIRIDDERYEWGSAQISVPLYDLRVARAALASPAEKGQPERYRHVKRGSFYTIVGESALQTDTPLTDMAELIVYRAEKDGTLWVRSKKEFYDGRFVLASPAEKAKTFQACVDEWMQACFGPEISSDKIERNHRFFEEATELVQSNGMTASEAHQLIDYTFGRAVGDIEQEVGGVLVTLAALCHACDLDMQMLGDRELARVWGKIEQIRAKQAAKPKHSPLPESPAEKEG